MVCFLWKFSKGKYNFKNFIKFPDPGYIFIDQYSLPTGTWPVNTSVANAASKHSGLPA